MNLAKSLGWTNFLSSFSFLIEIKGENCNYIQAASWEKQQSAYAKTKTQISFAVTAKLISAFVFASRIVQLLFYLSPKFQDSSSFLCLYRPVCVGPVRKPHCWFSHQAAHLTICIYCHHFYHIPKKTSVNPFLCFALFATNLILKSLY